MLKYLPIIISLISFIYKPLARRSPSNHSSSEEGSERGSVQTPAPLPKMASASRQCHGDKKPRANAAGGMNYVTDQPVTASFLGGIYSEGSDRSYLKPECYEFSPTDQKTKRSSYASQAGGTKRHLSAE